jgi:hypothetical protein
MPTRNTKNKLPMVTRGGRDMVKYDPLIALDVIEAISDGKTLKEITKSPFAITKHTFLQWVATVPELQTAYLTALRSSARSFEEMAIEAAEALYKGPAGKDKIAATNTYISQLRWSATRRDPTNYSDKGNTQIVVPVTINTPLDLGTGVKGKDVEDNSIYSLSIPEVQDAEFEEIEPVEKVTREEFSEMLRADEPVEGTERQPILESMKKKVGAPSGPRKRVLTPRIKDNG